MLQEFKNSFKQNSIEKIGGCAFQMDEKVHFGSCFYLRDSSLNISTIPPTYNYRFAIKALLGVPFLTAKQLIQRNQQHHCCQWEGWKRHTLFCCRIQRKYGNTIFKITFCNRSILTDIDLIQNVVLKIVFPLSRATTHSSKGDMEGRGTTFLRHQQSHYFTK